MSDNRKVIHVKDLVIKADNVYIERPDHHRRGPFPGSRRNDDPRVEGAQNRRGHDDESSDDKER